MHEMHNLFIRCLLILCTVTLYAVASISWCSQYRSHTLLGHEVQERPGSLYQGLIWPRTWNFSKPRPRLFSRPRKQFQGHAKIRILTTDYLVKRNSKYWGLQNCLQLCFRLIVVYRIVTKAKTWPFKAKAKTSKWCPRGSTTTRQGLEDNKTALGYKLEVLYGVPLLCNQLVMCYIENVDGRRQVTNVSVWSSRVLLRCQWQRWQWVAASESTLLSSVVLIFLIT